MPTLVSLMDLQIPASVEGVDLSRAALGQPGPEPDAAFMQGMGHTYMWIDGFEWRALRDKRYTYAVTRDDRSEHLFDNLDDPYQMRNLAGDPDHAGMLERFRALLSERMAALNDTFQPCTWYRDRWVEDGTIQRTATTGA